MGLRPLLAAVLVAAGLTMLAAPASAAPPVNLKAPSVVGEAVYDSTLVADPGTWTPEPDAYAYQWLRDGAPIALAVGSSYTAGLEDLGHRLAVQVSAIGADGASPPVVSAETDKIARAQLRAKGGQKIVGEARFTHTLDARSGSWSVQPTRITYQWLRFGKPIEGATDRRHPIAVEDVGRKLRVDITAKAPGYETVTVRTDATEKVAHRVDVRRTIKYHLETRGAITTPLDVFAAQAQQTFDDPRGWRGSGIRFVRVARGGSMTLVLSAAGSVPGFSSSCSSMWSCRVGRYVIINQERWKHASPAWNAAHGKRRDYRHMVVNHESGHFLGLDHAGCPGPGRPAPVMMQQSKGLGGCHFNPWPTAGEIAGRTPGAGRAMAYAVTAGYSRVVVD